MGACGIAAWIIQEYSVAVRYLNNMAELKYYGLGALTITVLLMLGYAAHPDDTHFCRDLEIAKNCNRLSSTENTCYPTPATRIGSKFCSTGWEEIAKEKSPYEPPNKQPGIKVWDCAISGCTRIQ